MYSQLERNLKSIPFTYLYIKKKQKREHFLEFTPSPAQVPFKLIKVSVMQIFEDKLQLHPLQFRAIHLNFWNKHSE